MGDVVEGALPVGDTGESLDTAVVETSEGAVHREGVYLGDAADPDARARVAKPDQVDFYAAQVTDHEIKKLQAQMDELIRIQRGMLKLLEAAFDDDLSSEISEEL